MLTEICQNLKNWFVVNENDKIYGTFEIVEGVLSPSIDLKPYQYFRIVGSTLNDGVHCLDNEDCLDDDEKVLNDEVFTGAIWKMSVPNAFLKLVKEIKEWQDKNAEKISSPYQSESFGGYSYSKASGQNGESLTWQSAFKKRLNTWRKV